MAPAHATLHDTCVTAWVERRLRGVSSEQQIEAFAQDFDALWQTAHRTLGDVTLAAIVDRVLHTCARRFPLLASLQLGPHGLLLEGLRKEAATAEPAQVLTALQAVMVEFLTILGNLTAEILTPALHQQLAQGGGAPSSVESISPPAGSRRDEEGTDS
jgi:hypothetical protein